MIKPKLNVVPTAPKPYDPDQGRRTIATLKRRLLVAVVRYIKDAPTQRERMERLREASDLSGIPRVLLEVAIR